MKTSFIERAKKRPVETVTVLGENIEVRGLSIGEIMQLTKPKKGETSRDNQEVAAELISLCCYDKEGRRVLPDATVLNDFNPEVFRLLNEAVTRVNGAGRGNSKATDSEDSSSD